MLSYGLERKEAFHDDKNVNSSNSKKWVFSEGVNPMVLLKKSNIFSSLPLGKIRLEIMFSDLLDRN